MDSEPKVREVEGDNDVVDTSLGQAKGMANRIIDRVYEVGPNNLSIVEMCAVADSYSRIAQATLQQQQVQQLQRIATAAERRNELLAEFNADSKTSAATHTEKMAESVNAFLDTTFGKDE